MSFYRIEQIVLAEDFDTYFVYLGTEEKEVKLNRGYTVGKQILDSFARLSNLRKQVKLYITYADEKYSIVVEVEEGQEFLTAISPYCTWVETTEPSLDGFVNRKTLFGSANPISLQERKHNLFDELAQSLSAASFSIQVEMDIPSKNEVSAVVAQLEQSIKELSETSVKKINKQDHIFRTIARGAFGGKNESYEVRNISDEMKLEIAENHLYTLNTQGNVFKNVRYTIHSDRSEIVEQVAQKLMSFSERIGTLSPYRIGEQEQKAEMQFTNSSQVAAILALPTSGIPGIEVRDRVEFGVDLVASSKNVGDTLMLGHLFKHRQTRIPISVPVRDLTRHTLVSGVTGSGKTSTIKKLLLELHQRNVPFLVIEPAKTEYKYLIHEIPKLNTYMLGIDSPGSFKLNPFEFPPRIHIQTHLDHLKSVFTAAFPMYGPMPYILERAFYQIYRNTGWDFISGRNLYEQNLNRSELFPTIEDLYYVIDDVTDVIGYSHETSSDVKGALKVRIGSLLSGAKGQMLNTRESNSIPELMRTPCVIELEALGDDTEKVFLIGLLLISVYENYASLGCHTSELQHLMVIEEAHRLLENVPVSSNNEVADMKGKAIEMFNNILSEIRTYGQGLVIADQIPTKLSPDVIKNTNLKIIHRLLSKDEREAVGHSIGLEEDQIKEIIRLQQGEAIIFHDKTHSPMKIAVQANINVLAQSQVSFIPPESPRLDPVPFMLQNETFRSQLYCWIHTYMLFPNRIEDVVLGMVSEVKRYFPGIGAWDKLDLLRKGIIHYIKETRLYRISNYLERVQMEKKLIEHDMPLQCFRDELLQQCEANRHPMDRQAPPYGVFTALLPVLGGHLNVLGDIVLQDLKGFRLSNPMIVQQLLESTGLLRLVACDPLSATERRQLSAAAVIHFYRHNEVILEHFFEYKSGTLSSADVKNSMRSEVAATREAAPSIRTEQLELVIERLTKSLEQPRTLTTHIAPEKSKLSIPYQFVAVTLIAITALVIAIVK